MAPIKDETVDALRDLVNKLESRVEQLEAKLEQADGGPVARKSKANTEGIRMILMGPPGAGKNVLNALDIARILRSLIDVGKGTQAPKIKDKYCVCHLVRYRLVMVDSEC